MDAPANRVLAALTHAELSAFGVHRLRLRTGQVLIGHGQPNALYFPAGSRISILVVTEDGISVEAASIGHEGVLGLEVLFGGGASTWEAVCTASGLAYRMDTQGFRAALRASGAFRDVATAYTGALFASLAQSSACNRLHPLEARCARWLLEGVAHTGRTELDVTHDLLATVLGVRRPSVTVVLHALQGQGVIRVTRGEVAITDAARLAELACECHAAIERILDYAGQPG